MPTAGLPHITFMSEANWIRFPGTHLPAQWTWKAGSDIWGSHQWADSVLLQRQVAKGTLSLQRPPLVQRDTFPQLASSPWQGTVFTLLLKLTNYFSTLCWWQIIVSTSLIINIPESRAFYPQGEISQLSSLFFLGPASSLRFVALLWIPF